MGRPLRVHDEGAQVHRRQVIEREPAGPGRIDEARRACGPHPFLAELLRGGLGVFPRHLLDALADLLPAVAVRAPPHPAPLVDAIGHGRRSCRRRSGPSVMCSALLTVNCDRCRPPRRTPKPRPATRVTKRPFLMFEGLLSPGFGYPHTGPFGPRPSPSPRRSVTETIAPSPHDAACSTASSEAGNRRLANG